MKLSVQHDTGGLSGHIRSIQTGEVLHFQFPRRLTELPLEVFLGDKRLEVFLRVVKVDTDHGDDLDLELTFRAPDVATMASLDYAPRVAPPGPGGKIDVDGAAMEAPTATDEVVIAEAPPVEKHDHVQTEAEKATMPITPTELAIQMATGDKEDLFGGEELVGASEDPTEHPATQVPALPGVGSDRKPAKRKR